MGAQARRAHETQGPKETAQRKEMHCHTSMAEPLRKIWLKSVTLKFVRMGSAPYAFLPLDAFLPLGTEGVAGRGDSGAQVSFAERRQGAGAGTGEQGRKGAEGVGRTGA